MSYSAEPGDWVRLTQTPGLGAMGARRLLEVFGLPENIFSATPSALAQVVPQNIVDHLLRPPSPQLLDLIARTVDWAALAGNRIMTLADQDYPPCLLEIADPPVMLYLKGRIGLLQCPALAIVGSRNASLQGATNAQRFARILSQAGVTIVSGMALGIDTAAHQGSLSAGPQGGSTIAVIGTGIDVVYPARNHELAHQIAAAGCLISEYALGTAGIPANFPRRNRLISGLSLGVLVVEAAARSGSLITARLALEQGRDVFAIPGSIHSALSKGCHQLIRQGAKLVESAEHIIEELPRLVPMPGTGAFSEHEGGETGGTKIWVDTRQRKVSSSAVPRMQASAGKSGIATRNDTDQEDGMLLEMMGFEPFEPGQLSTRCGLDFAAIMAKLLELELAGHIARLPGGVFQRLG